MSTAADILGSAPPRSWSGLQSDLVRLRRWYDLDDEERQARSFHSNQLDSARIRLLDELLDHIRPAVEEEARFYDLDRADVAAKDDLERRRQG